MSEKAAAQDKRESKMSQVQALLATAEHPNTPAEMAANYRAKAEQLMSSYRIEESELIESGADAVTVPITYDFPGYEFSSDTMSTSALQRVLGGVFQHTGIMGTLNYTSGNYSGKGIMMARVVGYEFDVKMAEIIYTAARTYFLSRLNPVVNPAESDAENVYRLRSAGITRKEIALVMGWDTSRDGTDGKSHAKVTKLYKQQCEFLGVPATLTGRDVSAKTFRESFCETFPTEFWWRLRTARNGVDSERGAIVLSNREDKVREAFYLLNPDMRPAPASKDAAQEMTPAQKRAHDARNRRAWDRQDRLRNSPAGMAGRVEANKAAAAVEIPTNASKRI